MTHDATALHVRNFYNGECAQRLAMELLMNDELKEDMEELLEVLTVGVVVAVAVVVVRGKIGR